MLKADALMAEFHAARRLAAHAGVQNWMSQVNWPSKAMFLGLSCGVLRVIPKKGRFVPVLSGNQGEPAIIMPAVCGPLVEVHDDIYGQDEIYDLVAWVPSVRRMFSRTGSAVVLGEYALFESDPAIAIDHKPLRVFGNPVGWANAAEFSGEADGGRHGILVVDWSRLYGVVSHLIGEVEFHVDSEFTAKHLERALTPPPPPKPKIVVVSADSADQGEQTQQQKRA